MAKAKTLTSPNSSLSLKQLDPLTYFISDPISGTPLYAFKSVSLSPFLCGNQREILDAQVVVIRTKYGQPLPQNVELRLKLTDGWTATLTELGNIFIAHKSRQSSPDPSYFHTPVDAFRTPSTPPFTSMLLSGRLVDRIEFIAGDSSPEYFIRNLWCEYQLILEAKFETAVQMEIDGEHMRFAIKEFSNGFVLFDTCTTPPF